jgi:outer membrane protein OmpA-like peptidoglycan-associated protein
MSPAVVLAVVIIVLLGILIMMVQHNKANKSSVAATDLTEIQAEASALRSQLNRERMAMGLRPLEGGSEPIEDIAKRLKKDADTVAALAGSFQSMLAEKGTELTAKSAELLRSEQLRQSLAAESARLQSELQRALVDGSGVDLLRRDLTAMKSQRDALAAELATVRQELAAKGQGASQEELADLKRQLEETQRAKEFFEAKVKELAGDLSQTKAKLFASSENELLPAAVELFRSLRQLENLPEAEVAAAYGSLGVKLGANVLQKFSFATGSSALVPADAEAVRNLVADIPDGDLVLAIGYASETGNVDKNRTLSSDRATAVAELFSSVKRPEQLVQAVYLGQTDRFGSKTPEANQVVEIWRIRKK